MTDNRRKFSESRHFLTPRVQVIVNGLRTCITNMHYCDFGPGWGQNADDPTAGDALHHMEIPFSGHRQVIKGKKTVDLKAGYIYFLPANTPVDAHHIEAGDTLWIRFHCEWMTGVDPLMEWPERGPCVLGEANMDYWRSWLRPTRPASVRRALELRSRVEYLLSQGLPALGEIIDRHIGLHGQFKTVYDLIEDRLGADLRVAELAEAHGSTPHAFTRTFSAVTQTTPKAFLNRRLNIAAIQLLMGSDMTLREIAAQLRFSDEFYFGRFFKKLNGCAPGIYRIRKRADALAIE